MSNLKEGKNILEQETKVFEPSLWIRCQKKSKDVPLHVCKALTELQTIPEVIQTLFPMPELPVADFIKAQLPQQVVKEEQQRGPCMGVNRSIHWWAPAPGARDGLIDGVSAPNLENGNSANAAISATATAKQVSLLLILSSKP